jgi:hypothetical protein
VFSQTLLAIPMLLLFEIGIFFARRMRRKESDEVEPDINAARGKGGGTLAAGGKTGAGKASRRRPKRP